LFERVCELDLEGIVAKLKHGTYVSERERSSWFKIKNRNYSQIEGREELFEGSSVTATANPYPVGSRVR
jgi:ATP-dependent DNA ligase